MIAPILIANLVGIAGIAFSLAHNDIETAIWWYVGCLLAVAFLYVYRSLRRGRDG